MDDCGIQEVIIYENFISVVTKLLFGLHVSFVRVIKLNFFNLKPFSFIIS